MITNKNTLLKITAGKISQPVKIEILAEKNIKEVTLDILDGRKVVYSTALKLSTNGLITKAKLKNVKAWSIEQPNLYLLNAIIEYQDGEIEKVSDRFGFRVLKADNKYIYLNGYPFYMRAYIRGTIAHEHQNNCNLTEYDFYKKNILTAKSYGFNTIRFHSVVPPDVCFEVADELGILIHIEMRKEKLEYNNLIEMLYGKNTFATNEEILGYVNRLYNHPSLAVYCIGNEIRQPATKPRVRQIGNFIKSVDPNRLFIDTCAHGEYDRDYVDFDVQHMGYFFPYGKNADMFENTDNLLCFGTVKPRDMIIENEEGVKIRRGINFNKPVIAHEICHYVSWRDYYGLKNKFEKYGTPTPWWVDEEIKLLESKGYKENFYKTLQVTKDYQFRCYKTAFENIRASSLLSGFHMLQFADTDKYENSNGIVDCFDDPHGISAEEFRKFNADCVLLAKLPKRIFTADERVKIPILISQFTINPPKSGEFYFELTDGENIINKGVMKDCDTSICGLSTLCSLEFIMPNLTVNKKLILKVKLTFDNGNIVTNDWETWVFATKKTPFTIDAKLDMLENYIKNTVVENKKSTLTITDKLNDNLFEMLENGENVLLIYRANWTRHLLNKNMQPPKYSFVCVWDRFKGVIWDRGHNNGGIDNKKLLNKYGFVTDGQINFQYYNLIEDSDKINLDDFPFEFNSLVSGLDKANRDRFDTRKFNFRELRYDRTMRNFSYCFSLNVGKGRLLVTGFNFTKIDTNPEVACMFKALVNYANSNEFATTKTISVNELKNYLTVIANKGPQKEGMMTQYWQLDDEPVESNEYWIESERYLKEN